MMRYSVLIIILFTFLIIGCTPKPIDIQVDSAPSKMVVFSHAIPNNIIIVSLTKSFSALDGIKEDDYETMLLSGATVQVTVDGQVYDFHELNPGFYASYTSVIGNANSFELQAIHQGDTITSKTSTSKPVYFENIIPIVDKGVSDTTVSLQLNFTDDLNEENFYMINVYRKNESNDSEFDNVNYFGNGSNLLERTILLSDLEFNSKYDEKIVFDGLKHDDSIAVTLSNISKNYYNYLVLRNESGSLYNQLNLEPLNYPTNVVNGYGFFNAHIPDIYFDDLSLY